VNVVFVLPDGIEHICPLSGFFSSAVKMAAVQEQDEIDALLAVLRNSKAA